MSKKYCKKTVLLGITGGIAAYKSCYIVSKLKKMGLDVVVIMTQNATKFVSPLTFETLSGNRVYIDTFEKREFEVEHIALAKRGDIFLVAPASANFLAKVNAGIADDMLTTVFLAFTGKKIIAPAMNTAMYENEATSKNYKELQEKGMIFIDAVEGNLACGDVGKGKMSEPDDICKVVIDELFDKKDFLGKKVLITAGGTVEDIDGVRCITNYSSGKMGVALAEACADRGGEVIFVYGNVSVDVPIFHKNVKIKSTEDMYNAVLGELPNVDVVIKAAAPCDFKVKNKFDGKIKDKSLSLEFVPNPDIAKAVGEVKGNKKLVVFAAETDNFIENAMKKLESKNADIIVLNNVRDKSIGFNSDDNAITLITKNGEICETEKLSKTKIADIILDKITQLD